MELPPGFSVAATGNTITVTSDRGAKAEHYFDGAKVSVKVEGSAVVVEPRGKQTRQMRAAVKTTLAHMRNMIGGLGKPYEKKLTLVYAHFPVSIEVKGNAVLIKNFLGEKTPRKASLVGSAKVKVAGQEITVEGPDKEAVGQTANNIAKATRITNKDIRVFQDGIYY